ncbi:6208_t:CDS:1 [Acaulospora colombiana]|uniref:6208_t:CDS:1 n=1 Tax=Acaulospora colombiana TaxID=27376 RepID=A0ACA9NAC0_9GLOM|nr:6208_t:CDS:1 [Acaulospora colombiana]
MEMNMNKHIESNPKVNAPNIIIDVQVQHESNCTTNNKAPLPLSDISGNSARDEANIITGINNLVMKDTLKPSSGNDTVNDEIDDKNDRLNNSPFVKVDDVARSDAGYVIINEASHLYEPEFQFSNESFCFIGDSQERIHLTAQKTNTWLQLNASGCRDVSNLTEAYLDDEFLIFNMTRFITCKRLRKKFIPPTKLQSIITDMVRLFDTGANESETSLYLDPPTKNIKVMILDEENSYFNFNVPVGLTLRFKDFMEDKILFEIVCNEASNMLFQQIKEEVVSKTLKKIADAYFWDDDFLDTPFFEFTNNIFSDSKNVIKGMILDMLVREQVEELERNTHSFLSTFFTDGTIYLQEQKNSTAFEIISKRSIEDNKNLIIKTMLNSKRERVWVLDFAE